MSSIDVADDKPAPAPPAKLPDRSMTLSRLARLTRKELRETLRDRRTIITLVLMPILVYPLLSIAFRQFMLSSYSAQTKVEWRIAADTQQTLDLFQQELLVGEEVLRRMQARVSGQTDTKKSAQDPATPKGGLELELSAARGDVLASPEDAVRDGLFDLGVRLTPQVIRREGAPDIVEPRFDLIYQAESPLGRMTADFVERRLFAVNQYRLRQQLRELQATPVAVSRWQRVPVKGEAAQMSSMAMLVPLVLILMTITGAVYPAIDLTAGERERGTLESLMAAPLPRLSMLTAKYVAVLTVALLTATANLIGMSVTIYSTGLGTALFGEQGLSFLAIEAVFGLLILFAAFFSALLLAVTSFARSFKEAQAYLIPFMLLAISPGFLAVVPGVELNGILAVTPLVNIVLLARDVLEGNVQPLLAGTAIVSTALYGAAALALAARIFGSDAILYGSEGSWTDLIRRPKEPLLAASLAGAALGTAIVFAVHSVLSGILALGQKGASLDFLLINSALLTVLVYAALPLVIARLQYVSLLTGFQLRVGSLVAYAGALLLGVSLWPLAHELVLFTQSASWLEKLEQVRELLEKIKTVSPILLVTCIAIVPAICEELFFRGYLLGALRHRLPAWGAILTTALLFGVFHVLVGGSVAGVRFLPSTCLGLVLGWVCWRSRSVLPGMLLHALHNGLLILVAHYRDALERAGIGIQEQQHLPAMWLAAAGGVAVLGVALVWLAGRTRLAQEPQARSVSAGSIEAAPR